MGNNINDGYADSNRFSDKALLIYNDFLHSGKFLTHYKWLKNAAETYDIKLELMGNSEFLCSYGTSFDKELIETLGKYRFILFWDKDIRLGKKFIALKQAIEKAKTFGFDLNGAVMASDAFFPFPDCVEIAGNEGVTAVIQPGGSVKDELTFEYCNEHGIAMVTTGIRHFKH